MIPGTYRASDADRDQVAEVLHTAYAEGRITLDEHAERTQAALEAKTFDELGAITADRCRSSRCRSTSQLGAAS